LVVSERDDGVAAESESNLMLPELGAIAASPANGIAQIKRCDLE
jgi:hypothetical protein